MMVNNFLLNYQRNLTKMETQFQQMSTGRKIIRMSDDPVGVVNSMSARTRLARLDQYQRNINSAIDWLNASETSCSELNDVIKRAYEYCVDIASDENTLLDRQAVAEFIEQLAQQVVTIGNSTKGEKSIFAGYNTLRTPFVINPDGTLSYNGLNVTNDTEANIMADPLYQDEADQRMTFEIGFGIKQEMAFTGLELMGVGENNIYGILREFTDALRDPTVTAEDLASFIPRLQQKQSDVLLTTTKVGGIISRLEMMNDRFDSDILNFTEIKSNIEDVDEAEAIMLYSASRMVFEAALSAGARIFTPTLLDYLR